MRIIFSGVGLSSVLFDELSAQGKIVGGNAIQKFSFLLLKGCSMIDGSEVFALGSVPRVGKGKGFERYRSDVDGLVNYRYMIWCRLTLLRYLLEFVGTLTNSYNLITSSRTKAVVVCDTLKLSSMLGALLSSKLTGSKSIALMTDMPGIGTELEHLMHRLKGRIILRLIKKFDGFVFVTKAFAEKLSIGRERYIVMECIADSEQLTSKVGDLRSGPEVTIYAGGLYREYGLIELLTCFERSEGRIGVLRIFGGGPLSNEVRAFSQRSNYIEYLGQVSNNVVTKELASASLLINPRLTRGEYTKYSFPIKNMEYMMSATPLLTSRLAGIPEDHYPYVYFLDEVTSNGIYHSINRIFELKNAERHEFGQKASRFIRESKSEIVQAQKLFNFFKKISN